MFANAANMTAQPDGTPMMPLRYKLRPTSAAVSRPPLLLLLHGSGADESDLFGLAEHLAGACGDATVASLRAPVLHDRCGFMWFDGSSAAPAPSALGSGEGSIVKAAGLVRAFIDEAPEKLGTDPRRVFLFGFSQGATISWTLALSKWPTKTLLAGVAALSGRAMPELAQPGSPLGKLLATPEELADRPPLLAAHGKADGVTPVECSRQTLELARKAGLGAPGTATRLVYFEHEGGHELPREALQGTLDTFKRGAARVALAEEKARLPAAPPQLPAGTRVRISGLASRPELNGTIGTILRYVASKGRYQVLPEGCGELVPPAKEEPLGLRRECLEVVAESAVFHGDGAGDQDLEELDG